MTTILFVDDEAALRRAAHRWFERTGTRIFTAENVQEAKRCLESHPIDGAFIDVCLRDGTGIELLAWIWENYPGTARNVVLLSGDIDRTPLFLRGRGTGAVQILGKPFDLSVLESYVARWAGAWSGTRPNRPNLQAP